MKIITATFRFSNETEAQAIGSFATLPGRGHVDWTGNRGPLLALPPVRAEMKPYGYAETFEDAMRGLAEQAGAEITIQTEGEWEELSE